MKIITQYKTQNGHEYPLELRYERIRKDTIVYAPELVESLCRSGCRNYGTSGGCPPFAPKFQQFPTHTDEYLLILAIFESKHKPMKVLKCKNRAIHWKFQDGILARFMDQLGRNLQELYGGFFLGTGYCMGCPAKKCAIKLGKECRAPQKRTFSLEATGIHVVNTVQNVWKEKFYWYTKRTPDVPYMMKCILYHTTVCGLRKAEEYIRCNL